MTENLLFNFKHLKTSLVRKICGPGLAWSGLVWSGLVWSGLVGEFINSLKLKTSLFQTVFLIPTYFIEDLETT